ncbi:hypothetical protein [Dinghuibacter silviterrae]|uniref:Uncharacterized protein n=1 Tax=Dinghuibacter silviterrae TaxID=1539049 RepID=A0A4R8DUF6_9BACT|nr:hypothetical protein [Dinghuibacter silviterrae]TDX02004.1 hypothetical protein EDB95_3051 [Dinghuibacter silviterrae]
MQELFSVLGWVGGGVFVFYCIGQVVARRTVWVSKRWENGPATGDLCYYLPTASLLLRITAKILVTRSAADNKVLDASLLEVEVDPCVNLEPDEEYLYVLHYRPFPFSNDVMRWSVNPAGLLESVSSTTEDRISQIVTELGGQDTAPQGVLAAAAPIAQGPIAAPRDTGVFVETQEHKNAFLILPSELRSGNFSRTWTIHAEGPADKAIQVDASFTGRLPEGTAGGAATGSGASAAADGPPPLVRGLLTRPLKPKVLELDAPRSGKHLLSVAILVPDHTRWMTVPVLRFPFVKNMYAPKFTSGILVENAIDKPSEVEGFLSIPVNVLKAIFSIPAQLFSFTVTHLRRGK